MKCCVVGGCGVDIVGFPDEELIFHDSNPGHIGYSLGCVGRNIGENIFRLGEDVRIVSVVGDDHNGRLALEGLRKIGMDVNGIEVLKDGNTATYLALLNHEGDMEIALSQMEIIKNITPEFVEKRREELESCENIVTETNLEKETLEYLLNNIKGKFFVDSVSVTKSKRLSNCLSNIYFLKTNVLEAGAILQRDVNTDDAVILAGMEFMRRGVKNVAITRGSEGASIFTQEGNFFMSSEKVKVLNTSGAGDAFLAGFVKGDLLGLPIEEKLKMAMAASLLTIQSEKTISGRMELENIKTEMKKVCITKM